MTDARKLEAVRKSLLAAELSDQQCAVLADLVNLRSLADGEELLSEGCTDQSLYVVVGGNLAVTRRTGNSGQLTLHLLQAGDMAGALGFVDGEAHSATLRAVGAAEVFSLERGKFEALIEKHPELVYRVMRAVIRTVHAILYRMNAQYVEMSNYITKQHGKY